MPLTQEEQAGQKAQLEQLRLKLKELIHFTFNVERAIDEFQKQQTWETLDFITQGLESFIQDIKVYPYTERSLCTIFEMLLEKLQQNYARFREIRASIRPNWLPDIFEPFRVHLESFRKCHEGYFKVLSEGNSNLLFFTKEDLSSLVSQMLAKEPDNAILKDWYRENIASVNNDHFANHREGYSFERPSVEVIKNFCRNRGLTEEQISFVYCFAHQNSLLGLLTYINDYYLNRLSAVQAQFRPNFNDSQFIFIYTNPDGGLSINLRGLVHARSFEDASLTQIGLINIKLIIKPHQWQQRHNAEVGTYFLPNLDFTKIEIKFHIFEKWNDPHQLKRAFASSIQCGQSELVKIEEIPVLETSFQSSVPQLII